MFLLCLAPRVINAFNPFTSTSIVRATNVPPLASAIVIGLIGSSSEPWGVDLVTFPTSLVGEY